MDTAQWPQGIGPSMESVVGRPAQQPSSHMLGLERRAARPQKEAALNCPRCNSTNTKFCYYNNYSLSQPRYFCKTCRRYWTEGGSLRNVPVGGGSRKNKRSSSTAAPSLAPHPTASSSSPNATLIPSNANTLIPQDFSAPAPDHQHNHLMMINPNKIMIHAAGQDLNLAYPPPSNNQYPNPTSSSHMSAMELLKMKSFPELTVVSGSPSGGMYASPPMGFGLHASGSGGDVYKPVSALNFSLDGFGSNGGKGGGGRYVDGEGVQESGGGGACRLLFPFEDLKSHEHHHNQVQHLEQHSRGGGHHEDNNASSAAAGYWNNGMIGTGGSW